MQTQAQITRNTQYKSALMGVFNKARACGQLDDKRTRRAFGILQENDFQLHLRKYRTTLDHCGCLDQWHNPKQPCKHRIALMILKRMKTYYDLTVQI